MPEYTLRQLADAFEMSRRTILYYVKQGLLQPPVFRGRSTTYDEDTFLRLRAICCLRDVEGLGLEEIRHRLDRLSSIEIAGLGASGAFALGLDDTGTETSVGPTGSNSAIDAIATSIEDSGAEGPPPSLTLPPASPGGTNGATWSRFALLPGLELHVRSDASPVVRRLAHEIMEAYGSQGS